MKRYSDWKSDFKQSEMNFELKHEEKGESIQNYKKQSCPTCKFWNFKQNKCNSKFICNKP